ncbi:hypothetical protein VP1G_00246 [Cytospora mali]|uniref:Uncharacterized protein n=1 Tax=Cytospora mali TaxID=578113 RepID=A0A194UM71_CYTMA|nr:hypothetical protein VP1G_00246 [Valsa mali var. pyri (nom. inval.)]
MVEATDIENLLATGTWTTQRAKSPRPPNPVRANQSFKLDPLGPKVLTSTPLPSQRCSGFPPPPSVEDEAESVAKEHAGSVVSITDEEPKCRGDIDQHPIILPVPEHNSERRYVLLTPSETGEDDRSDGCQLGQKPKPPQKTEYAANTKVQLDPKVEKDAQLKPQRRKSRADLPKIETHVPPPRSKTPSNVHRSSSATCVDEKQTDKRDYFSPRPESARPAGDAFLSPVIKHATKGRDRAYWNFNPGSNGTSPRGSAPDINPNSADRKGSNGYARSTHSASPAAPRRTNSDMEVPREARKTAQRHKAITIAIDAERTLPGEISPRAAEAEPPEIKSQNPDKRRNEIERPISPVSSGSSSSPRSRSRPRVDSRVRRHRSRAPSRTPSIVSNASTTKSVNAPAFVYGSTPLPMMISSDDRKRQTMPPSPACSRQSSLEEVHRSNHYWQPEPLFPTPRQSATSLEQPTSPVTSFRRFSEDVSAGANPGLPDCPRQRPRAGYSDWLTLPRSENFNICPSCYEQVFQPTEFRDLFIPASFRTREREIACDLGTSPWYRIAWLMTRKYRRIDLRLLQGVAGVLTREKIPCYGNVRVSRIWYSIIDPDTRRCIPGFNVCSPCAKAVEVLFPSLMGIFVPLDRPAEPKSGKCSMHFTSNRKRFLTYFDLFEKCHDRAMEERSAPDSKHLASNINFWSDVEECPRDQPLRHEYWYVMADIPEMTACEECFLDVVYPQMATSAGSDDRGSSVARNFYHKPHLIKSATVCQMASPWMRQLFKTACRRENGIWYMDEKVRERLESI